MGGAQPLAATMAGASCLAVECQRVAHRDAAADRLSRPRRPTTSTRRWRSSSRPAETGSAGLGRPARQRRRGLARAVAPRRAAGRASPTRPRRTIRSTATCRRAGPSAQWEAAARRDPKRRRRGRPRVDGRARPRHAGLPPQGVPTVDYGNNIRQMAKEEGVDERLRLPGLRAGLYPPAVLPRHRAVPLGRAVGRSRGHLPHRRQGEGAAARQRAPAQLARHGPRAHQLPGPAGAHLLGRAGRPPPPRASPSTRWSPRAS